MARPEKAWLDYFSMDVEKDNKLKFLKAKFWTLWFWMYVELLQYIYKEWYYIEWNDDNMLLFLSETGLKEEETQLMLEFMIEKWLFNKDLFLKHKILTSNWIQKRYAEWTRKRKNTKVSIYFWCVEEYEHIELMEEETQLMEEETGLKEEESTQRKGKEKKINYEEDLEKFVQIRNNTFVKKEWFKQLPKTNKVTEQIKKVFIERKKEFTVDEMKQWLLNYMKDCVQRTDNNWSYKDHRFTMFEFLKQANWLQKFFNS